ncbi:ribosome maturation factor RimP [Actinomadura hibisca]|uniref:ribosome maturation factor RimP n=1 Tax=Actinomadura hibisca TaxID=68565 RepID=UPI00082C85B2|nr:ribosome maturation factor RimP [Actinomadura hibisca]
MSVESEGDSAHRGRDGAAGGRPTREAAVTGLTRLLEPAVAAAGFDLEEVDVRPAGRRRLVKIVVDADGGVSLDDVAELSQTASELLDESEIMGASAYVLEVTSPGVDRPLTEPRHWRRAAGRLVVAPLTEGGQIEGRVVEADEESVVIDVVAKPRGKGSGGKGAGAKAPGKGKGGPARRRFAFGELGRGRVQVEFRRADERADEAEADAGAADETRSPAAPETSPAEPE